MGFALEVGVVNELVEVLDGPFLVGGDQTDVGPLARLRDHPHVTVWRVFWLNVEVQVTVVGHVVEFVLEACDDLHFPRHAEDLRSGAMHPRGIDDATAADREGVASTVEHPIGKLIFAIEFPFHFCHAMTEMNVRTALFGLFHDPSLEQVLLEHIAGFGQELRGAVRENDAHTVHCKRDDVLRKVEFQLFGGEVRQTFPTVNRRSNFGVGFEDHHGHPELCGVKRSGATAWAGADDHKVNVHLRLICHASL